MTSEHHLATGVHPTAMRQRVGRARAALSRTLVLAMALVAAACDSRSPATSAGRADLPVGELGDAALMSDGRLVTAGHTGVDGSRNLVVLAFDETGVPRWLKQESTDPTTDARAEAVAVDAVDRVVVVGNVLAANGSHGVVYGYDADGGRLWRIEPWPERSSELYALAVDGESAYVTGFARAEERASDQFVPPTQGLLVARIDTRSGALAWRDVALLTPDPLRISAGLSIAAHPSGRVGVAGVIGFPDSSVAWFSGCWAADGERLWQDVRAGDEHPRAPSAESGQIDVAREAAFDEEGNLYVVGDLAGSGVDGDLTLVKLGVDGREEWLFRRDEVLPDGMQSFDEGDALAVDADGVFLAGGTAQVVDGYVEAEGLTASLDSRGALRWFAPLSSPSLSGEMVSDLAVGPQGSVVYGGSDSVGVALETLVVERVDRGGRPLWTTHLESDRAGSGTEGRVERIRVGVAGEVFAVGYDRSSPEALAEPLALRLDPDTGAAAWTYPPGLAARLTFQRAAPEQSPALGGDVPP